MFTLEEYNKIFLSTPSARRATYNHLNKSSRPLISIHALREEGDRSRSDNRHHPPYFYPRPPRGGRLPPMVRIHFFPAISIHALREEGDELFTFKLGKYREFLSTPSARRATAKTEKNISAFVSL